MVRILRTASARNDLVEIGRHIATESQSLDISRRFIRKIDETCQLYARQPLMGTARPDLGDDVRVFAVVKFVVIYRPIDDGIEVLMVVHGSRNIPPLFKRRLPRQ